MPISARNDALKNAELTICGDITIEVSGEGENATSEIKMAGDGNYSGLAKSLYDKGVELINELNTVFSTFSGNTKEVVMEKIGSAENQGTDKEGKLAYVLCTTLPEMAKQIAIIIEVNRNLIEKYDTGLAQALQDNGQKN